jgi:hypothetical protein
MRNVSVDAATTTALVQGGTLTGDVVHSARPHNLVSVSGYFHGAAARVPEQATAFGLRR